MDSLAPSPSLDAHRKALQVAHAGNLERRGDYALVPTALFLGPSDTKLPSVAFYLPKDGELSNVDRNLVEKIREPNQTYSRLALSAHANVLVQKSDVDAIRKYAEDIVVKGTGGDEMPVEARMETLRKTAMSVVDDLFQNPSPENIDRSIKIVGSFVYVLMKDPKAYMLLAKLSSHDPYTLQHSVGTAVNCIILARKVGVTLESDLLTVGLAGLLHDIGKTQIKREIITKQGPLDEEEWEEMRQHSTEGFELVKNNPTIPERAKRAILEHHEDNHGTGYPKGLKGSEIDLFAKIVAICDIYNALTTDRTYSKAKKPYDAFQFMHEKLAHKIDDDLFKQLVLVYGGQVEE